MADEENTQVENTSAKQSQKNPFVTLVLLLNMVALMVVAYLQYDHMKKESEKPSLRQLIQDEMAESEDEGVRAERAQVGKPEGIVMPLDGFTVNLAQGDGPRRFVRLEAVLKFSKESKESEFTARKPQMRDSIISILNAKRPEDLLKREGKEFLKEEIKSAINSFLIDGEVIDVYYVGFQIN